MAQQTSNYDTKFVKDLEVRLHPAKARLTIETQMSGKRQMSKTLEKFVTHNEYANFPHDKNFFFLFQPEKLILK